jgi:hypothetical protein
MRLSRSFCLGVKLGGVVVVASIVRWLVDDDDDEDEAEEGVADVLDELAAT